MHMKSTGKYNYADPNNFMLRARLRAIQRDQRFKDRNYVAECLNTNGASIADYERGQTPVPDEIVFKAAELYNDIFLIVEAFQLTPYGKFFEELFQLQFDRITESTAGYGVINAVYQIDIKSRDLIINRITDAFSDGTIDATEREAIKDSLKPFARIFSMLANLICACDMAKEKAATQAAT